LGKLCDADCTAKLDKHNLTIYNKEGRQILQGEREQQGARLWRVNIAPTPANIIEPDEASINETATPAPTRPQISTPRAPTQPQPTMQPETMQPVESTMQPDTTRPPQQQRATSTKFARSYDLPNTPALVAYLHATAGYPVKSTWLAAIKRGAYNTWPGLTYDLAAQYCPEAQETQQGHMAQPRQHIRSTQPTTSTPRITTTPEIQPANPEIDIQVITANQLFTDDTGRFTPTARSGNQYIMVALHTQSNAILVQAFRSKHDSHRIQAYNDLYTRLANQNQAPREHILDNEASAAFLREITKNNCTYQLVPPHVHRRNKAERAIRTFKDHFLTILAGTSPTFPANRWDLLLPQAELTLNLLRPSHDTTTSAWESLFGTYNFDATTDTTSDQRCTITDATKSSANTREQYGSATPSNSAIITSRTNGIARRQTSLRSAVHTSRTNQCGTNT